MIFDGILLGIGALATKYSPAILGAIAVFIIGSWVIRAIVNGLGRLMHKRNLDPSLQSFLTSLTGILLKAMLCISVLSMLGIEMTSFVAILAAAGLAVGMALSGTLQNFAGGVMILIFKPYKVGDVIEAQGFAGSVSSIQIFSTVLKTLDNKTIIIPNGGLSTGSLVNYSTEPKRRVDISVTVAYGQDVEKAKAALLRLCHQDARILKDPAAPATAVTGLTGGVTLAVNAWVQAKDYADVLFHLHESIHDAFLKEDIKFPAPPIR